MLWRRSLVLAHRERFSISASISTSSTDSHRQYCGGDQKCTALPALLATAPGPLIIHETKAGMKAVLRRNDGIPVLTPIRNPVIALRSIPAVVLAVDMFDESEDLYHSQLKFPLKPSVYPLGKRTPASQSSGIFKRLRYTMPDNEIKKPFYKNRVWLRSLLIVEAMIFGIVVSVIGCLVCELSGASLEDTWFYYLTTNAFVVVSFPVIFCWNSFDIEKFDQGGWVFFYISLVFWWIIQGVAFATVIYHVRLHRQRH